MSQTSTTPEIVQKFQCFADGEAISSSYYGRKKKYRIDLGNSKYGPIKGFFELHGMASGCGLGCFGQWTWMVGHMQTEEQVKALKRFLNEAGKENGWYGMIATLGNSYISKEGGEPTNYEKLILSVGFKEVGKYINRVHSDQYY